MPLPLAIACRRVAGGLIGVAVERLIVRRFYKRPLDSLRRDLGHQPDRHAGDAADRGLGDPGHRHAVRQRRVGGYTFSTYRLVLFAVAVAVLVGLYLLFMKTRFGVMARATMQNAAMARALGVRARTHLSDHFRPRRRRSPGLAGGALRADDDVDPDDGRDLRRRELRHRRRRRRGHLLGTAPAAVFLAVIKATR